MKNKLTLLTLFSLLCSIRVQTQIIEAGADELRIKNQSNTITISGNDYSMSNGIIKSEALGDSCDGSGREQHDDGSLEESYGWTNTPDAQFVLKFTPSSYPWKYNKFCLGFQRVLPGADSMKFDIVIYDNTGTGGSPGNLLGQLLNQIARHVLIYPQFSWFSYDLSSIVGSLVNSGSVYIGIKYNSDGGNSDKFVMVDQTGPLWPGFTWGNGGPWNAIQDIGSFVNYKCLAMRTIGSTPTGIQGNINEVPKSNTLDQNYPNPFNPVTKLKFGITDLRFVSLKVYDILGNEIETLVNEKLNAGSYEIEFDGSNFPSGVYFYKLQAGEFVETKRMTLIK